MTRRQLLKLLGTLPMLWLAPPFLKESWAKPVAQTLTEHGIWNRVLILVELHGGNDGLNTLIPYTDEHYYDLRPRLAIPKDRVLQLSQKLGLHPALQPFMPVWEAKELAIVRGVGYAEPNRSHFRSIEIWETGSESHQVLDDGWLARVFQEHSPPKTFTADAILLGKGDAGPLGGGATRTIALQNPKQFLQRSQHVQPVTVSTTNPALEHILKVQRDISRASNDLQGRLQRIPSLNGDFPRTKIGRQLETAAQLLTAHVPVAAIKVTHGSFDTHARQANQHQRLLQELADALAIFRTTLQQTGLWEQVVVMTYSEFGRRVGENGSHGTDHGTAAPHFLLGGRVKGGMYGTQPSLTNLQNGDLRHTVDYRSLYATIIQNWWGLSVSEFNSQAFPSIDCLTV